MSKPVPASLEFVSSFLVEASEVCPVGEGVYFLMDAGEIVYVGRTGDLFRRVVGHKKAINFDRVLFLPSTRSEVEFLADYLEIETGFIQRIKPGLNGGGQTYPRLVRGPRHIDLEAWFGSGYEAEHDRLVANWLTSQAEYAKSKGRDFDATDNDIVEALDQFNTIKASRIEWMAERRRIFAEAS